uniref:Uncharacterized protein LOC111099521 n=1 Tax=Crassostrea virginica TaxID=6565 RepID=A0A8B8A4Y1_CRAVI|nr:uncharacterized protein LOC111099521 [Crassostrea virginica]
MYKDFYGYTDFKQRHPEKEPTLCFSELGVDVNGTLFTNFTCPLPVLDRKLTVCCNNTCCMPNVVQKPAKSDNSVTVAVTIVVVCAVGITLCMVLYCCCCQKRPGIHEGKLIWIKRKKDKIVYEEGGVSPAGSPTEDNNDEEVLGFVYSPDEKGHTDHSLEKPLEIDTPTQQRRILPDENGVDKKPDRDLTIPLITIRKPSTPGPVSDHEQE